MHKNAKDITGQRFNKLLALESTTAEGRGILCGNAYVNVVTQLLLDVQR